MFVWHQIFDLCSFAIISSNGANGMSNIEGKVTRVGASESGQRTSFKIGCRIDTVQFAPLARRKPPGSVRDASTLNHQLSAFITLKLSSSRSRLFEVVRTPMLLSLTSICPVSV